MHNFVRILMRFWHNTCLFFDHTKGDICDVVMYIIARTYVFWGITGQAKVSNTHAIFFMTFDVCIIWRLYSFCPRKMCYVWDSVIYIIARMNSKRRCVYKFVTYITLCKSRGDFDITHVFSFDRRKGDICDFVMYIIAARWIRNEGVFINLLHT